MINVIGRNEDEKNNIKITGHVYDVLYDIPLGCTI